VGHVFPWTTRAFWPIAKRTDCILLPAVVCRTGALRTVRRLVGEPVASSIWMKCTYWVTAHVVEYGRFRNWLHRARKLLAPCKYLFAPCKQFRPGLT
jgi:hypothetical protein